MTKKLKLANAYGMSVSSTFFGPSFQPLCKHAELQESWENPIFFRKNDEKSLKLKNEGEKRGEADRPWRQDLLNWPSPESWLKQCSSTNAALLF